MYTFEQKERFMNFCKEGLTSYTKLLTKCKATKIGKHNFP